MKKVLFVATLTIHIKSFHLPYLKWFQDQGYEVHVASNDNAGKDIPYCDQFHQIDFVRSPFSMQNFKAKKQLDAVFSKNHFDLVHTHTPMGSVLSRLCANKARNKNGTKILYTAHGFHFFKGASLVNWLFFYPIEWILAFRCDGLITINQEDYAFAQKKLHAKKVYYAHGVGLNPDKFYEAHKQNKAVLREKLAYSNKDFIMIFVAELNANKNQGMLLKALSLLKQRRPDIPAKLLIVGSGEEFLSIYQKQAKELDLQESAFFLGFRKDVPELLKIADVYLSSSHREGLPVNLIEAIYMQLPIIATNIRGQRDLVSDGKNGYLVPRNDSEKMSLLIEKLFDHPDLIASMQKASRDHAEPFMLDSVMLEMENIYCDILKS